MHEEASDVSATARGWMKSKRFATNSRKQPAWRHKPTPSPPAQVLRNILQTNSDEAITQLPRADESARPTSEIKHQAAEITQSF